MSVPVAQVYMSLPSDVLIKVTQSNTWNPSRFLGGVSLTTFRGVTLREW